MAVGMMELLGALTQGGMSPSSGARIQNAANASAGAQGGGLSGILSGLMGAGQNLVNSAGQAVGGKDNLAAAGIGALLGALSGAGNGRSGVPLGGIGGGVMGLLGTPRDVRVMGIAVVGYGDESKPPHRGIDEGVVHLERWTD